MQKYKGRDPYLRFKKSQVRGGAKALGEDPVSFSGADVACAPTPAPPARPSPLPELFFQEDAPSFIFPKIPLGYLGFVEVKMPLGHPLGVVWAEKAHVGDISRCTGLPLEGRCWGRREGV